MISYDSPTFPHSKSLFFFPIHPVEAAGLLLRRLRNGNGVSDASGSCAQCERGRKLWWWGGDMVRSNPKMGWGPSHFRYTLELVGETVVPSASFLRPARGPRPPFLHFPRVYQIASGKPSIQLEDFPAGHLFTRGFLASGSWPGRCWQPGMVANNHQSSSMMGMYVSK